MYAGKFRHRLSLQRREDISEIRCVSVAPWMKARIGPLNGLTKKKGVLPCLQPRCPYPHILPPFLLFQLCNLTLVFGSQLPLPSDDDQQLRKSLGWYIGECA